MEHALPRRTAGIPRTWALCMTSENHGTVGKAGDPFSHAPGKHERVQVVEIVAAGTPIAPDVDLAGLVCIDVADLIGKLGEVHTWARNLPIPTIGASSAIRKVSEVKEALAAVPVAAQAGPAVTTELQVRRATDELSLPELAEQFAAVEALGCDYTLSASVCGKLFRAMTTPLDCASSQAVVPGEQLEWSHDLQERLIAAGQDFDEHESVRQVMAEAACLLAALTGVKASTSGERQEGGAA